MAQAAKKSYRSSNAWNRPAIYESSLPWWAQVGDALATGWRNWQHRRRERKPDDACLVVEIETRWIVQPW